MEDNGLACLNFLLSTLLHKAVLYKACSKVSESSGEAAECCTVKNLVELGAGDFLSLLPHAIP
jgi:hypothetical protein